MTIKKPDAEQVFVAWLAGLVWSGGTVQPGDVIAGVKTQDETPATGYITVTRVDGGDDKVTDRALVEIEYFAPTYSEAKALATAGWERCQALTAKTTVVLLSGESVRIDWRRTTKFPTWVDYQDDSLFRFVGQERLASRITNTG